MSDYDNFLRTPKILNKQLQTYFNSPAMKALIDQQKVAQAVSSSMKNIISNSGINFTYKSIHDINAALAQSLSQPLKLSDEVSRNISQLVLSAQLTDSFSPLIAQRCKELSHTIENPFPASFEPLLENIAQIKMHESYVSIPEALIPDDFQCEEIADNSQIDVEQPTSPLPNTKKLPLSEALCIINTVMVILMWIVEPFYTHAVESILSREEIVESPPSITEEQTQQILEYLSELTDYQQSILAALEASGELIQESDSCSDDTEYHLPSPDSPTNGIEESSSVAVDELENSEQHQTPEQR